MIGVGVFDLGNVDMVGVGYNVCVMCDDCYSGCVVVIIFFFVMLVR